MALYKVKWLKHEYAHSKKHLVINYLSFLTKYRLEHHGKQDLSLVEDVSWVSTHTLRPFSTTLQPRRCSAKPSLSTQSFC